MFSHILTFAIRVVEGFGGFILCQVIWRFQHISWRENKKESQKVEENQSGKKKRMSRQIIRERQSSESAWHRGKLFGKRYILIDK